MKKVISVAFIFLVIGLLLGREFFPKEKLITKVQSEQVPITKTISIKDESALSEAKEVYAKAFQLFLANLGLKLDSEKKEKFSELLKDPSEYLATTKEQTKTEVFIPREIDFTPSDWFKKYVQKEKANLKHITDDALISEAQGFILSDPALFYARSSLIKKFPKIKKVLGNYKGVLYRIAGENKGRRDDVRLGLDFSIKDEDSITGSFSLKLSADGDVYSNSQGQGGNGDIKIKDGSIIIEAGPGRFFHFKGEKLDIANFYEGGKLQGFARFNKI
ncbi:MAG: hypothetical protein ACJAT2_003215 [Bacteriovoracaceae bacterium]|jgi:hypothetical protein